MSKYSYRRGNPYRRYGKTKLMLAAGYSAVTPNLRTHAELISTDKNHIGDLYFHVILHCILDCGNSYYNF